MVIAEGKLVPAADGLREQVLQELHVSPYSGHLGTNKTFKLVTRHYWWPGVTAQVRSHCETCHQCQMDKPRQRKPPCPLQPVEIPHEP